jgi:hypothetical protein
LEGTVKRIGSVWVVPAALMVAVWFIGALWFARWCVENPLGALAVLVGGLALAIVVHFEDVYSRGESA